MAVGKTDGAMTVDTVWVEFVGLVGFAFVEVVGKTDVAGIWTKIYSV